MLAAAVPCRLPPPEAVGSAPSSVGKDGALFLYHRPMALAVAVVLLSVAEFRHRSRVKMKDGDHERNNCKGEQGQGGVHAPENAKHGGDGDDGRDDRQGGIIDNY